MEINFSPGPWRHNDPDDICAHLYGDFHHRISAGYGYSPEGFTLSAYMSSADAHLITAAPDLYEALGEALRELETYELEATGERYNNLRINAALAKARGETP